jgi:hypothetical protein
MDLFSLTFLGGILMALVAGDAVINSNTMSVSVGLPPAIQQTGLTRNAAEEIFITEIANVTSLPSPLNVPTPRVATRRTIIGAIAEPLKLTDMTAALQDLFRLDPVRVSATMLQTHSGLTMEVLITQEGRQFRPLQFSRPDADAAALIRSSAIGSISAISPYRYALFRLHGYLNGLENDHVQVRTAIDDALTANWTAGNPVERSALFNISAILSLLDGDISRAQREVDLTQSVIASTSSVITAFSMNAAFISILSGNLEKARENTESAIASSGRTIPIRGFDTYLQIQRGLLAWAEGNLEGALSIMQVAQAADPNNRTARIYVAWLRHLRSGATGRFDPLSVSDQVARYNVVPQLMSSAFLLNPRTREIMRAPASMDRR